MSEVGKTIALIRALGTPTDAQVTSAVEGWLDDHPEATTTVEDGSITNAKLASSFVTPGTAAAYSSSATYAVGDYVFHGGALYRCIAAITTAEAWTAAHWAAAVLGDDIGDLKSAFDYIASESPNLYNPTEHYHSGYQINSNGAWGGGGNNATEDVIGYIPVHGLEYVTVALFCAPGADTNQSRYCWYGADKSPITTRQTSFPNYGENKWSYIAVPENAYYLAFQVTKAFGYYIDGKAKAMVQAGQVYTGYEPYGAWAVIGMQEGFDALTKRNVFVSASDSLERYKKSADFLCTGTNDEQTIQSAIDSIGNEGTVYLAPGTYNIDSFTTTSIGKHNAITIPCAKMNRIMLKCYDQIPNRGSSGFTSIVNCAVLNVTDACYSALDGSTEYSVIACDSNSATESKFRYNMLLCDGIGIKLPDNQKNIVGFDGKLSSGIELKHCMVNAVADSSNLKNAANGCIGFRVTNGSNFGINAIIERCAAYGCYIGFELGAEHYIVSDCKTIYNDYGYYFNNVNALNAVGAYCHPNTIINCCSEMDFNYPFFGYNVMNQPITMIDFNIEHRTAQMALGGDLAKEAVPGSWRGNIGYTIKTYSQDELFSGNNTEMPFWADGYGENVASHNDAQKQICTTSERESYAANPMNRVFDKTVGKFFTFTGAEWVEG